MEIARINVNKVYARAAKLLPIPQGIVGATVSLAFEDPAWENLSKLVVFRGWRDMDVFPEGDTVTIPWELTLRPGKRIQVGICGRDQENKVVIPTLWADLGPVYPAAQSSGSCPGAPTVPAWAQLRKEMKQLQGQLEQLGNSGTGGPAVEQAAPGQMIIVKAVDEKGKPTAWEAVDRTHWTEGGGATVLPETTVAGEEDLAKIPALGLVAGEAYTVNLEGTAYPCVAWEIQLDGFTVVGLGDLYTATEGAFGTAPTGEPFSLMEAPPELAAEAGINVMIQPLSDSLVLPVTFSITGGEAVHKLDNKYLDLDWVPEKEGDHKTVISLRDAHFESVSGNVRYQGDWDLGELEIGSTYELTIDNVPYQAICKEMTVGSAAEGFGTLQYIGNLAVPSPALEDTAEDTGEDFYVQFFAASGFLQIYLREGMGFAAGSHSVTLTRLAKISRMPREFMPELLRNVMLQSPDGAVYALTVTKEGAVKATKVAS